MKSDFEIYLIVSRMDAWIARVDEIKLILAVNLEAERKVAQLEYMGWLELIVDVYSMYHSTLSLLH